ncbi:FkbM family methyltransferase [Flavobacterium johnsoniae]|uniref:Methyltransferase FkbM family n=1 Tax=Flavobacterium johnsoniae (strain ATCC 17061 / DSM 2064 / JCM 8514 / BCRC 14874 / CCUG 350202 / NBRC 14942 / NCIMB 11054 / UW101) TaxID=376686 RepID=A5FN58_FLAJ1|nr:FkbM family methyltransferase [Flavobacterium johnsoniae]ABQ03360.1 methyltransferase FkbM family [Flavobacterium johnsoniae UW101]OXG01224.1 FkbM family methyltransferase [Flavobacterium johnsoniae UW101]WQG79775.1 FkbM family methyltransferase [Flavobacterium johnsoniae UW101]SHL77482.1 methyltransferase, FkbM family [Flavobacterium johnsoniae]
MKKKIKKAAKLVLNKLGYNLTKISATNIDLINTSHKNYLLFNFYNTLKEFNFQPKHIVDVGANHGTWTREALLHFPDAYYTLLEPQEWLKESFQDILDSNPKVRFHAVGAGQKKGSFLFTIVDRDDSCSFRYTKEEALEAGFKQLEIPVVTLNELLLENKMPVPDIIKIDAEGLDIEVLKGADSFFGKTEIFMVESGIVNKTLNNNLFSLVNFMDENGYRLFEITDLNRPFALKVLWLAELVFVKKDGFIDSQRII